MWHPQCGTHGRGASWQTGSDKVLQAVEPLTVPLATHLGMKQETHISSGIIQTIPGQAFCMLGGHKLLGCSEVFIAAV